MNFSIRQMLIVTVALAILVATVSSIFRLKQTQVQIVQAQQLIAEKNTQEKQLEFQLKNVDGVILKRTIELDALREMSDPEQSQKIIAAVRERILSELKLSSESITVAKLPSLDGLTFAINVPNDWDVYLKIATNETDSTVRDVKPPYSNFQAAKLNPGQHILDVIINDVDFATGSDAELHDLIIKLDSAELATYRLEYQTHGLAYTTGSKSAYFEINRHQLSWKHQFISSTNVQHDQSHLNWKIWLDKDDTQEEPFGN